jgi:predicted nucleotidyltransferase
MDNIPDSVREIINNYLKSLEAHHIRIRKVVLFGSYVTGKADEWSDIDVALVSDDFEGDWFKDRNRIRRLTLAVDNRLSPVPYRPESLLAPDPFFKNILETGIAI